MAHVEAGLRTYDPRMPWPEEEYRTAIDARANLLFAPTETSAANLRAETVQGEIHVTGNTGIDALLGVIPPPAASLVIEKLPRILVTCHRRESWSEGLRSISAALTTIARDGNALIDVVLHPNPHVAATIRQLLDSTGGISLIAPCSHSELVRRMCDAELVLSDSGGIQEEASALGAPLLILREKTERPECLASGNARLVGTSTERIVAEVRRLLENPFERLAMARTAFPFGDGHAGPRIAGIITSWLKQRPLTRQLAPEWWTGSPDQNSRNRERLSSRRFPRSISLLVSPKASKSGDPPRPTPSTSLPPESRSTAATWCASSQGWRR